MKILLLILAATAFITQSALSFDGRPWNVSTGNLSVNFIQASPIGALPRPNVLESPPRAEALAKMKTQGLVAYEDYVAWGAIEREPGQWDWTQHDRICDAIHQAGLKYVVYNWNHFPPTWLRDSPDATLMRCVEHNQATNYLSIFDPGTLAHYDRFYRELAQHFGDRIDGVYACISGPYGEGNYPRLARELQCQAAALQSWLFTARQLGTAAKISCSCWHTIGVTVMAYCPNIWFCRSGRLQ